MCWSSQNLLGAPTKSALVNGACAHYVMVSKFQWKPFWLATQRDPQSDWTATQNGVNYDVFAQAPSAGDGWVNGSAPKGHLGKTVFGLTGKVDGKRFWEERNSNKNVSRVRSGKSNADVKDKLWRPLHACFKQAWDSCLISVARLSLSTVDLLPNHIEAVLCSLYSHHAAAHTKFSTNTPTNSKGIKRTGYSTALSSTLSVLAFYFSSSITHSRCLRGAWSDRDTNDTFAHCSLIFYYLDFKFSNFVCPSELHPLIWFFLKNSFRKKKNIRKTSQNALAPSIFIVWAIVLKLGTPLLHIQAQNTLLQNF